MITKIRTNQQGFTVIETIVYLALFVILMTGAVVTAYDIYESSARNAARILLQQDGDFLLGKINWTLSGVQAINLPQAGRNSSELLVTTVDPSIGSIDIKPDSAGINVAMTRNNVTANLNSSNVTMSNLVFDHELQSGVEWVTTSFTLTTNTSDGKTLSQAFQATKYLRK